LIEKFYAKRASSIAYVRCVSGASSNSETHRTKSSWQKYISAPVPNFWDISTPSYGSEVFLVRSVHVAYHAVKLLLVLVDVGGWLSCYCNTWTGEH